jgi:hypothetical protein
MGMKSNEINIVWDDLSNVFHLKTIRDIGEKGKKSIDNIMCKMFWQMPSSNTTSCTPKDVFSQDWVRKLGVMC